MSNTDFVVDAATIKNGVFMDRDKLSAAINGYAEGYYIRRLQTLIAQNDCDPEKILEVLRKETAPSDVELLATMTTTPKNNSPDDNEWLDEIITIGAIELKEYELPEALRKQGVTPALYPVLTKKAKQAILTHIDTVCREASEQAQIKGEIIGMRKAYRKAIMGAGEYHDDPHSYVVPIEHLEQYEHDLSEFDLKQPIFRDKTTQLNPNKDTV